MIAELILPVDLPSLTEGITLRRASREDLQDLVALIVDDAISNSRGDLPGDSQADYRDALEAIITDPCNELVVGIGPRGQVIATFQLTRLPGLARKGATRLQIEAVRVDRTWRGHGIGTAMMRWVMNVAAPAVGASLVQLTSDAAREDAHRFYERLGMVASHVGFKYAPANLPG